MDHAGLPLKTVLEQLDILGEEVVPVLRREFAKNRPADVPAGPTHESLVLAAGAGVSAVAAASAQRDDRDTAGAIAPHRRATGAAFGLAGAGKVGA
jgi:hypothetical protein